MVHKVKKKSVFFLGNKDTKDGELWSELADDRKYRQHPHGISDNDAHAVPKNMSPILRQEVSQVETDVAMEEIQQKIDSLRTREPGYQQREEVPFEEDEPSLEDKAKYREDWTD